MKIITTYIHPPIPIRCFDWQAVTNDYDGAPDASWPANCIGYGNTEAEAIADLNEQLDDGAKDPLLPF